VAKNEPVTAILADRQSHSPQCGPQTNHTLQLRQDTPPNAFARDSLLVADLLARGSLSLAAFPEALTASSGKIGHRLAAYSCGGSRGIKRTYMRSHRVPI
jgi:hypothetical protein